MTGFFEHHFHALRIGDEVGRQVAAVELHAFDGPRASVERRGFLDRDHAVLADLVHCLGDDLAMVSSLLAEMVPTWATHVAAEPAFDIR